MAAKSILLLGPMLCALFGTAAAQDPVALDPTVAEVTTGGHWKAEGRTGAYRVIIRTGGIERATSEVTVEWLVDPTRSDGPTVMKSVAIKELSGLGRIDRPRIGQYLKGWRVWITVSDTHAEAARESSRSIDVGAPGELRVIPVR